MRHRFLIELALMTALLPAALVWLADQPGLSDVNLALYDHILAWNPQEPSQDLLIIGIDQRSLRELGPWPWPRSTHAELLEQLAAHAPRAVLFDVFFDRDSNVPGDDARLAAAMRALPVYLPLRYTESPEFGDEAWGFSAPIPLLLQSARGVGHANGTRDEDGVVRTLFRYEGFQAAVNNNRALQPYVGLQLVHDGRAPPGDGSVLQRPDGWNMQSGFGMRIAGPAGTYRAVPYVSVLRGKVPDELLRGRDVLIGAVSDARLGDRIAVAGLHPGELLPGIEMHANAIDALRHGRTISTVPHAVLVAWAVVPVVLAVGLFLRLGRRALAGAGLIAGGCMAMSLALFAYAQLWLPPTAPLLGIVVGYLFWSWRRLDALFIFFGRRVDALNALPAGDFEPVMHARPKPLDVLEERTDALDRAIERLKRLQLTEHKAYEERAMWLRFLSHDLRSPQVSILNLLDLQAGGATGMSGDVVTAGIRREAERTLALTEGFMDLTEAESGKYCFDSTLVGIVLLDAIDQTWPYAQARGVTLMPRLGGSEGAVHADGVMLTRAVVNLLNNAIRHTPRDRCIYVCLETTDEWVSLSVRDEGEGMDAAQLQHLLRQDDEALHKHGHAGPGAAPELVVIASARARRIGLSVVHAVVAKHGGWIDAWSAPGEGTTIVLGLPPLA